MNAGGHVIAAGFVGYYIIGDQVDRGCIEMNRRRATLQSAPLANGLKEG